MKKVVALFLMILLVVATAVTVAADDTYPNKTITIVCPWSAGGGTDTNARMYADAIASLGIFDQRIVVVNHTGGSGVIGATEVVEAVPDGYTLLMTEQGCITVQTALGNTTYDYTDLVPIVAITNDPIAMVVAVDSPITDTATFISKAQETEYGFNMGFAGAGTFGYLGAMDFLSQANVPFTEVQFDGTAEAITAVMGGHVDTYIAAFSDLYPYVASGEVRMVWTSLRTPYTPEGVEVLSELGFNVSTTGFCTLYGPKGLPDDVREILFNAFKQAQTTEGIITYTQNAGRDLVCIGGEELEMMIKTSYETNYEVLKRLGRI